MPTQPAAASGASWHVTYQSSDPYQAYDLNAVTCPAAGVCISVGTGFNPLTPNNPPVPVAVGTGDGWGDSQVASQGSLPTIACTATTSCLVSSFTFDSALDATTNAGSKWTANTLPFVMYGIGSIACVVSTGFCQMTSDNASRDLVVLGSSDGGSTWTSKTLPASVPSDASATVTCPSVLVCEIVGSDATGTFILGTRDGGTKWTSQLVPAGVSVLNGVGCVSTASCFAWDSGSSTLVITRDGGRAWTTVTLPVAANGVSCWSYGHCEAVGNDVATRTVNSGATWHTEKLPKAATGLTLNAVACSSASLCYAAGQDSIPFEGYEVGGGVFLTYS